MLYWPRCRVLHEENEWHFRIQYASIFSFHDRKLSQEKCFMLYVYSTELFKACFMKEAIDSFVVQFLLTLENTRSFEFQFHVAKLSQ